MQIRYRRDVQGLRAMAVVLVALDHADVGPFTGGFVGVDVFFVISGFLITSLLLVEAEKDGHVSLLGFYARRARRILPAATLVTLATVVFSVLFASAIQAASTTRDAVWATFFAANFRFASQGTDYFALDAVPSPLQHYWSLAVEEQFYLVWPLLVLVLCLLARRSRRRMGRRSSSSTTPVRPYAIGLMATIVAASFAWSVVATLTTTSAGSGTAAYFSPFTRAWELGLGALAAALAPTIAKAPGRVLGILAALGLGMVAVAALGYDAQTGDRFPGYVAALPVLGATLLLLGGMRPLASTDGADEPQGRATVLPAITMWAGLLLAAAAAFEHRVGHLSLGLTLAALAVAAVALVVGALVRARWAPLGFLEVTPARIVGDWSYSFYLWHWPVLILARSFGRTPSGWYGAALLVGALALSGLSYHFVENPARRARWLSVRQVRGVLLYPAVVVITIPLLVVADRIVVHDASAGGPPITAAGYTGLSKDPVVALVQASAKAAMAGQEIPAGLKPSLLQLPDDRPDIGTCDYFAINTDRPLCLRGDPTGTRSLVLIGDSHARQWIPALDVLAARYGYQAHYLVREGCPAAEVTPWLTNGSGPSTDCQNFQDWAAKEAATLKADVVILGSHSNPGGFEGSDGSNVTDPAGMAALLESGMTREIDRMPAGARVIVMGDAPPLLQDPGDCLSSRDASLSGCSTSVAHPGAGEQHEIDYIDALKAGTLATKAQYVDTTPWFCAYDLCPAVIGDYIDRRDVSHVSTPYSAYLADEIEDQIHLADG